MTREKAGDDWRYEIYINSELVDTTMLQGIAELKFKSAELLEFGIVEMRKIYQGNNYDPVLHYTEYKCGGILPPCPPHGEPCKYHKSKIDDWASTSRPTAFRMEVMPPQSRCGFLLKPHGIGGDFYDYAPCISPSRR
jgi:hypothetical protein